MSVIVETTLGDITIDLYLKERPKACLNFLKLCKIKYYNYNLFHTVNSGFIAQTGDPTGSRTGGESIFGVLDGPLKRYFEPETQPRIKHTEMGLVSFVGDDKCMIGSQFFITLAPDLNYLDNRHCVFGEVVEGFELLEKLNEAICDGDHRPYQDIRITHTIILDDPFPDPQKLKIPERSPSPSAERLQGGRIAPDEDINEFDGKTFEEIEEMKAEREAKARATILEMVGDIPDAEMAPPENVLFVCKLNPVTTDDDLEIIFSRFGKINSCEVIRDRKTGDSLQYAFIEFNEKKSCEDAYFKMDNVLIDDRRIHVDFSQSVAKIKWHGKGRGVTHFDDQGRKTTDTKNDTGKGNYKKTQNFNENRHPRNTGKSSTKSQKQSISPERKSPPRRYRRSRSQERYRDKRRNGNHGSEERRDRNTNEINHRHYIKEREKRPYNNYRPHDKDYYSGKSTSRDKRSYEVEKSSKYEHSKDKSKEYKYENKMHTKGKTEEKYDKKRDNLDKQEASKKSKHKKRSKSSDENDDREYEKRCKHKKNSKRKHRKSNTDSDDDSEEEHISKRKKTKKRKKLESDESENDIKKRRVNKSKRDISKTKNSETSRKKRKQSLKHKRKRTSSSSSSTSDSSNSSSSSSSSSSTS